MNISLNIKRGIGLSLTLLGVAFSIWVVTLIATAQTNSLDLTLSPNTASNAVATSLTPAYTIDFVGRVYSNQVLCNGLSTELNDITTTRLSISGPGSPTITSDGFEGGNPSTSSTSSGNIAGLEEGEQYTISFGAVGGPWYFRPIGESCQAGDAGVRKFTFYADASSIASNGFDFLPPATSSISADSDITFTIRDEGNIFSDASRTAFTSSTIDAITTLKINNSGGADITGAGYSISGSEITVSPPSGGFPMGNIYVSFSQAGIYDARGDAWGTGDIAATYTVVAPLDITITGPTLVSGNLTSEISARDDEDDASTTFTYKYLDESSTPLVCDATTFNGVDETNYNEGQDIIPPTAFRGTAGNGYSICFRSVLASDSNVVAYAKSSQISGQVNPPTPTIALINDTNVANDNVTSDNRLRVSGFPAASTYSLTNFTHIAARYRQNASGACDTPTGSNGGWRPASAGTTARPWNISPTLSNYPLEDEGDWCVTSRYTALGVSSAYATPIAVTYDNTAPGAPDQPDLIATSDTFYSSGTNTHGTNSDNITSRTNASFTLRGLETGTGATIDAALNEVGGNGQAGISNRAITLAAQSITLDIGGGTSGTHNGVQYILIATQTDLAGNQSPQSQGLTVTYDNTAPTVTDGPTFSTDNTLNPRTHAKEGDEISATFDFNEQVEIFETTFAEQVATTGNLSGNEYRAIYVVVDGVNSDNAPFDLGVVADLAGNSHDRPADDTGVRIDTIAPDFNPLDAFSFIGHNEVFISPNFYFNAGDTIGVVFNAPEALSTTSPTITLLGRDYQFNNQSGNAYATTFIVVDGDNIIGPSYDLGEIVDEAGNTHNEAPIQQPTWIFDTTAPDAPDTPDLEAAFDSHYDNGEHSFGTNEDNITSSFNPRVRFSSLEDTATLNITSDNTVGDTDDYSYSVVISAISINPHIAQGNTPTARLQDGDYDVTATQTDIAGNNSPASTALRITIDTVPPAAPVETDENPALDLQDDSDTGTSQTDNYTRSTNPTFNLIGDDGAIGNWAVLEYEDQDNAGTFVPISSVAFDNSGNAELSDTASAGYNDGSGTTPTIPFRFIIADPAGNTANSQNRSVYFDTIVAKPRIRIRGEYDSGKFNIDAITNITNHTNGIDILSAEAPATNRGDGAEVILYKWVDANTDDVVNFPGEVATIATKTNAPSTTFAIQSGAQGNEPINFITAPFNGDGLHLLVACQTDDAGNNICTRGDERNANDVVNFRESPLIRVIIDTTDPDAPTTPDLREEDDSFGENANGARSGTNSDNVTNIQERLSFGSIASGQAGDTTETLRENNNDNNHDHHQIRFYKWVDANTDVVVDDAELTELKTPSGAGDDNVRTNNSNIVAVTGYDTDGQGRSANLYTTGNDILEEGVHYFVARQYDIAGNLSASSTPFELEIDVTRPAAITGDLILHPTSDTGTSPVDKQTSNAAPIFRIEHTSDSTDVDYYEIRRLRLTDSFVAAAGEDWEYPSDSSVVQQTSYEYFKTTDTQERTIDDTTIQVEVAPTLTDEAGATQADGAYQNPVGADFGTTGVTVAVTSMDITHFNTWYAFKIYPVDLAGNTRQGVDENNVRILVLPPVPSTVDLQAADDSAGAHFSGGNADNITSTTDWTLSSQYQNLSTPERDNDAAAGVAFVEIKVAREDGAGNEIEGQSREIRLSVADADITAPGSPNDPYTFSTEFNVLDAANFGPDALDGVYAITAIAFNGGGESGTRSQPLRITLDRVAPVPQEKLDLEVNQYFVTVSGSRRSVHQFRTTEVSGETEANGAVYIYDVAEDGTRRITSEIYSGDLTVEGPIGHILRADQGGYSASYQYFTEYVDAAGNASERTAINTDLLPPVLTSFETATDTYVVIAELLGTDTINASETKSYTIAATTNTCHLYLPRTDSDYVLGEALAAATDTSCVIATTTNGATGTSRVRGDANSLIADFEILDADDSGISADDNITNNTTPQLTGTTIPTSTGTIEYKTDSGDWDTPTDVTAITLGLTDYDTEGGSRFTIDIPSALSDDTYNVRGHLLIRGEGDTPIGPIDLPDFTIDTTVINPLLNPDNSNAEGVSGVNSTTVRFDGFNLLKTNTSGVGGTDDINERYTNTNPNVRFSFISVFRSTEDLFIDVSLGEVNCANDLKIAENGYSTTAVGVPANLRDTDCDFSTLAEGEHTFTGVFSDTAGNIGETRTSSPALIKDTLDPAITILRLGSALGTAIDANTRFIAVTSDNSPVALHFRDTIADGSCNSSLTTGFATYNDGATQITNGQLDPTDGGNGVCFRATDLANNVIYAHTDSAIVGIASLELDAPGTTYQNVRYAQPSSSTTFTGVSASGALAKLYVVDDGETAPTSADTPIGSATVVGTSVSITSPYDFVNGSYDIYGSIVPSGGTETPLIKVLDLTIDSSAPSPPSTFEFTSSSSKSLITNSPSSVGLTFAGVSENLAIDIGPESDPDLCKINEGNTSETYITGTCDLSSLTDTTYTLETEFISRAGVRADGPDLSIEIDTTAPSTTFTYVSGNRFLSNAIRETFLQVFEIEDQTEVNEFGYETPDGITFTKLSGNRYSAATDITTDIDGNGVLPLFGRTITDAAGNSSSGNITTAIYLDTEAPTISSVGEVDVSDRRAPEITVVAVHNQDAANAGVSETLTPIFTGRCSEFAISNPSVATSSSPEDDVAETYVFVGDRPRSGAYSDCTIALSDEAGNTTAQTTIPEFRIRSSGGGLSRSLGSGGSAPATLEPVTFTFTPIEGETLGPIPSIPTQAPIRITSIQQGLQELQRLRTILSQLRASLERSIPQVPRTNLIRIPIITPTLIPTQTPTQTRPFTPFIPLFAPPIPNTFSPQLPVPQRGSTQTPFTPFIPSFSAPTPILPSLKPPLAPAPGSR